MPDTTALCEHLFRLRDVLATHAPIWRARPFHEPRPAWCDAHPALCAHLLALDDAHIARLAGDDAALIALLTAFLPEVGALATLIDVPTCSPPLPTSQPPISSRLLAHVPGRKQAQITAFSHSIGKPSGPVLEWCAGKGHLGRLLAARHALGVTSLEWRDDLVEAGRKLAQRAGLSQHFVQLDVLSPASAGYLPQHHAVALHACGDLHVHLLRAAVAARVPALDLVPCCYDRIAAPDYVPLNDDAGLTLRRDDLHLAVTGTVTSGARELRRSVQAQIWKLAFLHWRTRQGVAPGTPFAPVPESWLDLGLHTWLVRVCTRVGIAAPSPEQAGELAAMGAQRLGEVRRLDLARFAFRRALELWLVLDRAVFLQRHGYHVTVRTFCARELTPRNLLISARLEAL